MSGLLRTMAWRYSHACCAVLLLACSCDRRRQTQDTPKLRLAPPESIGVAAPPDAGVVEWRQFQAHRFDCPVHHTRLREGVVPIRYGKGEEDEAIQDERDGTPYAMTYVAGGCGMDKGDPQWARVFFCERCRADKARRAAQLRVAADGATPRR